MTAEIATRENGAVKPVAQDLTAIERVIVAGDLSKLSAEDRWSYYQGVCQSLGLNPFTRPFEYITLNGKLTLYAKKDCADQLRKLHGVSIEVVSRERIDDVYVVTARAIGRDGRHDEEIGAVSLGNLRGDALANALMKATTKAKRRVTLSICGLGMLDETEVESIPGARRVVEAPALRAPTAHEQARAAQIVGQTPGRAEAEVDFVRLVGEAVTLGHPQHVKLETTDPKALSDDQLVKSIDALARWVDRARTDAAGNAAAGGEEEAAAPSLSQAEARRAEILGDDEPDEAF